MAFFGIAKSVYAVEAAVPSRACGGGGAVGARGQVGSSVALGVVVGAVDELGWVLMSLILLMTLGRDAVHTECAPIV